MKILVLSLLRIGDIAMSAPVLRALHEKFPDAELHMLINRQCRAVVPLMPYVQRVIEFDRETLQLGLGEIQTPVFESYDHLAELVDQINGIKYDWVINLTHNRLSGWLASLIQTPRKTGLCLDPQGRPSFGSEWFRDLNSQVHAESSQVFHFNDIFRQALNLPSPDPKAPRARNQTLIETEAGRQEAERALAGLEGHSLIAVQVFTSDTKKDWGLERFAEALEKIQRLAPEATVVVLSAPFEKERLTKFVQRLQVGKVRAQLAILSIEGVFSALKRCRLLLTGDTSIKHLAAMAGVPIVEVSIGPSDVFRTGPYLTGSIVVRTMEACAPCPHSKACHRETHACAQSVPSDVVASVATEVYAGRLFQLRELAQAYRTEVEILRVDTSQLGFWTAVAVNEVFSEAKIGRWLNLVGRRLWLKQTDAEQAMGSIVLQTMDFLRRAHPTVSDIQWQELFSDFERQLQSVDGRLNSLRVGLHYLRGCFEDPKKLREFTLGLISMREKLRQWPLLSSFKEALDQAIEDESKLPFARYRHLSDVVSEIEGRLSICLRLVRGLAQQTANEPLFKTDREKS